MARKLIVEIVGDADSLQRTFRQVGRETQSFGAKLGQVAKGAAVAAGALGATGLAFAIATGTKELREQQRVAAQTNAAIKSTGGIAGVTAKHITDLGLALSNLSGVDDEVIKGGANLLLSFENIRNSVGKGNDIFDRATKAALDFAVRTGRDVPAAAVLLGKALEDPATKVSALARAGVVFSTAQKKVIADLVKTGHALEAQKIILGELEERFGGAAKAAGGTLPGRLRILQERFQDLTGDLLTAFLPSLNRAVLAVTKIVQSFSQWSAKSENQRKLQEIVNSIVEKAIAIFRGLRDVLVPLARVTQNVVDALGGMRRAVQLLIAALIAGKIVAFTGALTGLSAQALVATGRVSALRLAMLRLGAIGVITLGIEVILNREAIDKKVSSFLEGHGLGFFAGNKKIEFPFEFKVENLGKFRELRDNMAKLKGDNDLVVKGLDKIIERLEKMRSSGIRDANLGVAAGKKGIDFPDLSGAVGKFFERQNKLLRDQTKLRKDADAQQTKTVKTQEQELSNARQLIQAAREHARALAEAAVAARRARQFEALGLTATGEVRIPGVGALKNRLGSLRKQLEGTVLDTPKTQSQLQRIGKVLSGRFGKVGKDVRSAILQMFNDIASALNSGAEKGQSAMTTAFKKVGAGKLIEGLGLSPQQVKELRQRLAQVGPGGTVPGAGIGAFGMDVSGGRVVIENHIFLDGKEIASNTTKQQQKKKGRGSPSRRGVRPGM